MKKSVALFLALSVVVIFFVIRQAGRGSNFEGQWVKTEKNDSDVTTIPFHVWVKGNKFRVETEFGGIRSGGSSIAPGSKPIKNIFVSDGSVLYIHQPKYAKDDQGVFQMGGDGLRWDGQYENLTQPLPKAENMLSSKEYPWPDGTFWSFEWAHVWDNNGPGEPVLGHDTVKYQMSVSGAKATALLDKDTGILLKLVQPMGDQIECKELKFATATEAAFEKP